MQKLFDKKGYSMKLFIVEANLFGVLQNRKRIIIVGWRKDILPVVPDLETIHLETGNKVRDLLSDLPEIMAGQEPQRFMSYADNSNHYLNSKHIRNGLEIVTQHIARPQSEQDREIYRMVTDKWNKYGLRLQYDELPQRLITHKNTKTFKDRFKVVAPDEPFSQTVVAHIAKDGHYYIHPDIKQNRSLSVREAARLQSFPDDYYFEGIKENGFRTAAFKQIGNAVPPLMAYEIANEIKKMLWKKI
jgi:DNA (cytosine-5)-methyltransferase 1